LQIAETKTAPHDLAFALTGLQSSQI